MAAGSEIVGQAFSLAAGRGRQAGTPALQIQALFLIAFLVAKFCAAAAEEPLAQATIVVFNNAVSESRELAKFYAEQRDIPRDHLVGLDCSLDEEISREQYDQTIADPLRHIFSERGWWKLRTGRDGHEVADTCRIHFVALMKGMPLKIRAATSYPGDQAGSGPIGDRNEACVDSEIAVLGAFTRQISGARTNPYFQSFRTIGSLNDPALLLVCRLDAADATTVRRMITDSIETERNGLWGRAYVDGAGHASGGLADGDQWMQAIVLELHKVGIPVVFDNDAATFPTGYPMTRCALYYGWYAGGVEGPFADADFHFLPGAIAVHIHSFSAATLRSVTSNWVAPLLAKGAAAALGNVYEPYLQLTAHLDIFHDRLLHGFTFAESAYMSMRTVSWMDVAVGDPLYRPYASWLQIDGQREETNGADAWKFYHAFAQKNVSRPPVEFRALARQSAFRSRNAVMIEDLGLMELGEGNFANASAYFQQARSLYQERDDILRVVLEQARALVADKKNKRALELVRSVLKVVPDAPAAALLRKLESDLGQKPAAGVGTSR